MKNVNAGTILRFTVLILALINQVLAVKGLSPIPVDEETISTIITIIASIIVGYKDNPVTKEGKIANNHMKQLKAEKKLAKVSGKSPIKENIDTEGDI